MSQDKSLKAIIHKITKNHIFIKCLDHDCMLKVAHSVVPEALRNYGQPITITLKDDGTPLIEPREITQDHPGEEQLNVWVDNMGTNT